MGKRHLLLIAFLSFFLIGSGFISADGGYFPHPGYWVSPGSQRAVIFYENNIETMILTSDFRGNAKDLVWIIPTPSKPDVTKANEKIFENVQKLVTPQYARGFSYGAVMEAATSKAGGVIVLESKQVDYYDVNVLLATNSQDLVNWFNENNYSYPETYAYVLKSYIDKGWYFTAIKVSPEAQGATEVIQDLEEGHPTPVKMVFLSDKMVFPLKISSVDFEQTIMKYGFASDEPIGATRKDAKGNVWTKTGINSWQIMDNIPYGYEGLTWGDVLIDEQPGGKNYIQPYYRDYIPIYLYVIAEGKYESDGSFYISYGNWITKSQVEKLGDDENGNPYIKPEKSKYFLTYLTANMQKSQMDDDLILKKAEDNKKVNAGPEAWQLALYGFLIGLFVFISWVFTPLGIMFIAGTLILFLASNKVARVFGWVMEAISLLITFILAAIFLGVAVLNNTLGNYAVLGVLITSIITLLFMISLIIMEIKYKRD